MTFQLEQLVQASTGLQKIILQDLPIRTAYKIMKLTEKVNPHLVFYGQEILKAGEDIERCAEVGKMIVDGFEDFEPITVSLDSNIKLTASDIKFLEPFIVFTEDSNELNKS